MSPPPGSGSGGWKDIVNGGMLQCIEAATLGMPLEVWKTRMGRFRGETSLEAFGNIYRNGGLSSFWQGTSAKMVESASKGAVLLYSKELILSSMEGAGWSETTSGFVAGAGGGIAQTVVMGPCTFVITSLVTQSAKNVTVVDKVSETFKTHGVKGFYSGATAIAFRQATNWASRQGLTEMFRTMMKNNFYTEGSASKLTVRDEALAGVLGGALSTWNQPFEVARIIMQSSANEGGPKRSLPQTLAHVVKTDGFLALYKGIVPRVGLGIWQTLFMVTGAKLIREYLPW